MELNPDFSGTQSIRVTQKVTLYLCRIYDPTPGSFSGEAHNHKKCNHKKYYRGRNKPHLFAYLDVEQLGDVLLDRRGEPHVDVAGRRRRASGHSPTEHSKR